MLRGIIFAAANLIKFIDLLQDLGPSFTADQNLCKSGQLYICEDGLHLLEGGHTSNRRWDWPGECVVTQVPATQ